VTATVPGTVPGTVTPPGAEVPVRADVDVAVVDATLTGAAAALRLAETGHRVAPLEPGYSPGTDLTAANRPWPTAPDRGAALPDLPAPLVPEDTPPGARVPMRPAALELHLEDALLAAGVQLLYGTRPVAEHRVAGRPAGLVVADVSGRALVACRTVLTTDREPSDDGHPGAPDADPGRRDTQAWRELADRAGTPPAQPLPWRHDPHRADLPPRFQPGRRTT
jgi:choline dehydrogenase-like flavoprotein